jgi:alpha-L-rhamnosidase
MQKWIAYIHEANPDLIRRHRLNNNYGDWVSIESDTPKELLATAYFARGTRLLARVSEVLGYTQDAAYYESLFQRIKLAFNQAFVDAEAHIKGSTQTGYILALAFDLLPEDMRDKAAEHLVEAIEDRKGHLSTGFLGVRDLLPTLADNGYLAEAYRLLMNETFPSWGYEIANGATTIWERWDGWTREKGFQDPEMNSFNHYSFGSVGEWLYATVAGIDLDRERPGYKGIVIRPRPGGGLRFAKGVYHSIHGTIASRWERDENRFELEVEIPVNTDAVIHLPAAPHGTVEESGVSAAEADGVRFLRREIGREVYAVGSGKYVFRSTSSSR